MNDQVETQDQGLQGPSGTPAAVLKTDIQLGNMSLIDLMRHIQNLESLGEIRAAANLCALWINFAPANDKHYALFNYGGLLQGLGQFEEAQKAYESCMAMREDFPQAYINLGLMFEKRGHSLQALNTWLLLISIICALITSPTFTTSAGLCTNCQSSSEM
jgi:tetratricopeptide (TPR) repeat protein